MSRAGHGGIAGLDERDRRYRAQQAQRDEQMALVFVRNRCVSALAELPDPAQALEVVEGIRRSILEHMAAAAAGPVRVG